MRSQYFESLNCEKRQKWNDLYKSTIFFYSMKADIDSVSYCLPKVAESISKLKNVFSIKSQNYVRDNNFIKILSSFKYNNYDS